MAHPRGGGDHPVNGAPAATLAGVDAPVETRSTAEEPPTRRPRTLLRRLGSAVLLVGVLAFAARAVVENWQSIRHDVSNLGAIDLLASSVAALVGLVFLWLAWARTLAGLGSPLPRRDSMPIYFAAQIGKYLPGSVWPAVIQAQLGRRHGVSRARMVTSYALWMAILCLVGAVVGLLVLTNASIGIPWWVVILAALLSLAGMQVLLHERGVLSWVGRILARLGRPIDDLRLAPGTASAVTLACLGAWLAFGVHAWLLARPLGAEAADVPLTIGAFALAFVAGIVVVPLPAGAGVRETVLVLTLGVAIQRGGAVTVALLSRSIMIVAELLLASGAGVPAALRAARQRSTLERDQLDDSMPVGEGGSRP